MWRSALKISVFFVLLNLLFTSTTDADMIVSKEIAKNEWAATTLDFSSRDTASGANTNLLFNTSGIRPGGFQIKAIRVQKDGVMSFDYQLSAEITGGDASFCGSLSMTILENWQKKYSGKLSELKVERKMEESGQNDWVLVLNFDSNDQALKNKSCNFNFVFKTKNTGFSDEEKVENQVNSGSW